jgi:hypothetical protein
MSPLFDSPHEPSSWFVLPAQIKNAFRGVLDIVRVGGIELPTSVWKTDILPLNYTRFLY